MPLILSATENTVWPQWLIFGVYMAVILAVALVTRRKSVSVEGFMFANKGVGGWLSAFAYGATYFSAVVFVGYAGKFGWNFGLSAVWIGIGNMLIGTLAAWLLLARRTKAMTTALQARTMPEFFEKRYESKYIKLVAALIIFVFLLPYSASVYQGMGYIFDAALGIGADWCIFILAALTALYLFLGGYFATTITDFIQGMIMIVGIMVTVFMLLGSPQMYERSAQLLDDCFAAYKLRPIAEKGQPAFLLPTDVKGKSCRCACDETCAYPLTDTECARLRAAVKLPPRVCLPVRQGQDVGNLQIFLANQLLFSLKIVSIETIDKNILDILREIAQRN